MVSRTDKELMTASPDSDDWILPRRFGRYEIVRRLGIGGMAEVYLAIDASLGRQVALKTPLVRSEDHGEAVARFQREARAASRLQHPGICPVYEAGEFDGTPYLSMLFVEGTSLTHWMREREVCPVHVLAIMNLLAEAVHHAHEAGVIHRDIKPGNIMMTPDDRPIIMDFGLTRDLTHTGSALTPAGMMMGTPTYMSPEQIMADDRVGPATDIYSLGVVMYELLTGWLPFSGNVTRLVTSIVSQPPPPLRTYVADIDPRIESVCLRALEKEPQARFATAEAFADEIEHVRMTEPSESPGPTIRETAPPSDNAGKTGLIGKLLGALRRDAAR